MELNSDFSKRVVVHGDSLSWQASPMPGVKRRMYDRIGEEVARATSVVSYAPGSQFSAHVHGGGEEFLILEGVFEDEHGAYPAGSYVRNPPQSAHTPGSAPGCIMLVKLWQFDPDDRTHIIIDTNKIDSVSDAHRPGVAVTPLFRDPRESVRIETFGADVRAAVDTRGGAEIFVLAGGFSQGNDVFRPASWLRLPIGEGAEIVAGPDGAKLWIKSGHLAYAQAPVS
ncbi:MAG: cupin domain-containing protein [Burkholderiaceae bacterium]